MNKVDVIEKLKKLRLLIDQGVGGEKINAQNLFDQLCKKYNISNEDIFAENIKEHVAKVEGDYGLRLINQIFCARYKKDGYIFRYLDPTKKMLKKDRKILDEAYGMKDWNVLISCTDSDFIQIMFEFDVYSRSMKKSMDAFFYAFLDKNKLLVAYDENNTQETTDEEREMYKESLFYSAFMSKTQIQKQIE